MAATLVLGLFGLLKQLLLDRQLITLSTSPAELRESASGCRLTSFKKKSWHRWPARGRSSARINNRWPRSWDIRNSSRPHFLQGEQATRHRKSDRRPGAPRDLVADLLSFFAAERLPR